MQLPCVVHENTNPPSQWFYSLVLGPIKHAHKVHSALGGAPYIHEYPSYNWVGILCLHLESGRDLRPIGKAYRTLNIYMWWQCKQKVALYYVMFCQDWVSISKCPPAVLFFICYSETWWACNKARKELVVYLQGRLHFVIRLTKRALGRRVWDYKIPRVQDVNQWDLWKRSIFLKTHWLS
jgi:hypothetical protein